MILICNIVQSAQTVQTVLKNLRQASILEVLSKSDSKMFNLFNKEGLLKDQFTV